MAFRTSNDTIINETVSADVRSEEIQLTNQYLLAVQTSWTNGAAPSIVVKIEVSLDRENWFELSSPTTTVSGASGIDIIQLTDFAYNYARIFVDVASGSADLKVQFNGKGI